MLGVQLVLGELLPGKRGERLLRVRLALVRVERGAVREQHARALRRHAQLADGLEELLVLHLVRDVQHDDDGVLRHELARTRAALPERLLVDGGDGALGGVLGREDHDAASAVAAHRPVLERLGRGHAEVLHRSLVVALVHRPRDVLHHDRQLVLDELRGAAHSQLALADGLAVERGAHFVNLRVVLADVVRNAPRLSAGGALDLEVSRDGELLLLHKGDQLFVGGGKGDVANDYRAVKQKKAMNNCEERTQHKLCILCGSCITTQLCTNRNTKKEKDEK